MVRGGVRSGGIPTPQLATALSSRNCATRPEAALSENHVSICVILKFGSRIDDNLRFAMGQNSNMDSKPLAIYLDSSDFSRMASAASGTEDYEIGVRLKRLVAERKIAIGLSYFNVFELLQAADAKDRTDRIARAETMRDLSGHHAYPHIHDFDTHRSLSADGVWLPRSVLHDIEIGRIITVLRGNLDRELRPGGSLAATRKERRRLRKQKEFVALIRSNPDMLHFDPNSSQLDPLFLKLFAGDLLRAYVLGELSRHEANQLLLRAFCDPVVIYEIWFERYGKPNPIDDLKREFHQKLVETQQGIRLLLDEALALQNEIKRTEDELKRLIRTTTLEKTNLHNSLKELKATKTSVARLCKTPADWRILNGVVRDEALGVELSAIICGAINAIVAGSLRLEASTALDVMHACYLPLADLWRGDRRFALPLRDQHIPFASKIVPNLSELIPRIEQAINRSTQQAELPSS